MHQPRTTTRRARAMTAVAAMLTAAGALALPTTAEAGLQTESDAIVASAIDALSALDSWHDTRQPADLARYEASLAEAATLVAVDLEVPAEALLDEWEGTSELKQVAMLSAFTQLGVPYRSLASKPGVGFDCSGLTTWAYRQAGVELPRISREQIRSADELDEVEAEPGDLAYYPGHVSIYIGQGLMVHSPNSGNRVEVRPLPSRSHRFGDAFTDEAIATSPGVSLDATLEVTVDPTAEAGAESEVEGLVVEDTTDEGAPAEAVEADEADVRFGLIDYWQRYAELRSAARS